MNFGDFMEEIKQFDAGREGARRLHRVLSLYCALFCWKNNLNAVFLSKDDLYKIIGITRIEGARKQWLEEDIRDYFEFFFTESLKSKEYFVFSRKSSEELKGGDSKLYKILTHNLDVLIDEELEAALVGRDSIFEKLPFLQGATSSASHLLSIQITSLATGVIGINDMFK
jgi:hypothetical protein